MTPPGPDDPAILPHDQSDREEKTMAERPADVPAAVRQLFSTSRMSGAWNMLSCAQNEQRDVALAAIVRLLDAQGLTLADIATTIAESQPVAPSTNPMASAFSGFGDIFAHMRPAAAGPVPAQPAGHAPQADHAPVAPARAKPSTIVQGRDIPTRIYGRIAIRDDTPARGAFGRRLVIGVVGQDAQYDPIICFDADVIAKAIRAAESDQVVSLRIRPPAQPRHLPCATSIDL
jgi:hypothetical protein